MSHAADAQPPRRLGPAAPLAPLPAPAQAAAAAAAAHAAQAAHEAHEAHETSRLDAEAFVKSARARSGTAISPICKIVSQDRSSRCQSGPPYLL